MLSHEGRAGDAGTDGEWRGSTRGGEGDTRRRQQKQQQQRRSDAKADAKAVSHPLARLSPFTRFPLLFPFFSFCSFISFVFAASPLLSRLPAAPLDSFSLSLSRARVT